MNNTTAEQTGGAGFSFENKVQTSFLINMIIGGFAPCYGNGKIIGVKLQGDSKVDDLVVEIDEDSILKKMYCQIKANITFSDNEIFNKVIKQCWDDFNTILDKKNDKIAIIKKNLNHTDTNDIKPLFSIARSKNNAESYFKYIESFDSKRSKLNIFRDSIEKAKGCNVTNEEIWHFFKSIHILSYDYGTIEQSKDYTNILNLIKLAKSNNEKSAEDIFKNVFFEIVEKNKNSGEFCLQNLSESIKKDFDFSKTTNWDSIKRLEEHTQRILNPITEFIGRKKVSFNREIKKDEIKKSILENEITFIEGKSGVGKSALAKSVLNDLKSDGYNFFTFKSNDFSKSIDEFNASIGISERVSQVFDKLALINDKIIHIESAENFLEIEDKDFIKSFWNELRDRGVKLLITCREYARNSIVLSIFNKGKSIESDKLNETEIKQLIVEYPELEPFFNKYKGKSFVDSLKLIEVIVQGIEYENLPENLTNKSLRDYLWKHTIQNENSIRSNAIKRSNCFSNLVVKRATTLNVFENVEDVDMAYLLEKENILTSNDDKFAPAFDIFEDWALIKQIESLYSQKQDINDFFSNLKLYPAIRRAFRIWINESIEDNDREIVTFLNSSIIADINSVWKDEIITAILKSDYCTEYIELNKQFLLENHSEYLKKFIHILKISCQKYVSRESNNSDVFNNANFKPQGLGWFSIIKLLHKEIQIIGVDISTQFILNFLTEWKKKHRKYDEILDEDNYVGEICIFIINSLIQKGELKEIKSYLEIVLVVVSTIQEPIKRWISNGLDLYNKLVESGEIDNNYFNEGDEEKRLQIFEINFYNKCLFPAVLSPLTGKEICRYLPEFYIEIWKTKNYFREKKVNPNAKSVFGSIYGARRDYRDRFGIRERIDEKYKASPLSTPFQVLLFHNDKVGIDFLIDLTNYILEKYQSFEGDDFTKRMKLDKIKLELENGKIVEKYGNIELWCLNKHCVNAPDNLQSILMAFEEYLHTLLTHKQYDMLKVIFEYIILKSKSIILDAIILTVALENPLIFGRKIIPLLKVKQLYKWEFERTLKIKLNQPTLYTIKPLDKLFNNAYMEFINKSYQTRGIEDIVVRLNFSEFQEDIWKIIDDFKDKNKSECDIAFGNTLLRIDMRKIKTEIAKDNSGILILPNEDKEREYNELNPDREAKQREFELDSIYSNLFLNTQKVLDREEIITYDTWVKYREELIALIDENYQLKEVFGTSVLMFTMFQTPAQIASIGVRDFRDELSPIETEWCFNAIKNSIDKSIELWKDTKTENKFGLLNSKEVCFNNLGELLISSKGDLVKEKYLKEAIIYGLIFLEENDKVKLVNSVRIIWNVHEIFCIQSIYAIIKYFKHKKSEHHNPLNIEKNCTILNKIITDALNEKLDFEEIDYQNSNHLYFLRYILFLMPFNNRIDVLNKYVWNILKNVLKIETTNNSYDYPRNGYNIYEIRRYFALYLLNQESEEIAKILNTLFADINYCEFLAKILEDVILETDRNIAYSTNFSLIFDYTLTKNTFGHYKLNQSMLLGIEWKVEATNWKPIEGKEILFGKIIQKYCKSKDDCFYFLRFMNTIGKMFIPIGLKWLGEILFKNEDYLNDENNHYLTEKILIYIFQYKLNEIRSKKEYTLIYLDLLNIMIEKGSSPCYFIRDNFLIYVPY